MKRIVSVILAMLMLVTLFGIPVYAQTTNYSVLDASFTADGFTVESGVATATTSGATAKWELSYAGDAHLFIHLGSGSKVSVTIEASGISYTKDLSSNSGTYYNFGCYSFEEGDTITITNTGTSSKIGGMYLTPVAATYLDVTMIDTTDTTVFSNWGSSSLKNYNGTVTYYGSGTATWDIPESVTSLTDIYYYFPEKSTGAGICDSSLTFALGDAYGNSTTWTYGGTEVPYGWQKVGSADFTDVNYKTITVSKGPKTTARLTAFRFVENENPYHTFLITPESMISVGGWKAESDSDAYGSSILHAPSASIDSAIGEFEVPEGTYYLYVNSCDFDYAPATRVFSFKINGTEVKKRTALPSWVTILQEEYRNKYTTYFGSHQHPSKGEGTGSAPMEAWKWEKASSAITVSSDGKLNVEAVVKTPDARWSAIMISQDPFITLDQDVQHGEYDDSHLYTLADTARHLSSASVYDDSIDYPTAYEQSHASVSKTATLSNSNTTVTFKLGTLPDGSQSVKRQIKVGDVETVSLDDGLGFLALYAEASTKPMEEDHYPKFNTSYTYNDTKYYISTYNVFQAGQPEWLIPTTLEQVDSNTVTMTATGTLADITATWTLGTDDKEPKVSVTATTKKDGEYSFGFFNNASEVSRNDVSYILNPYRWQERRYPDKGTLVPEAFSTTNHTQMTYNQNSSGQEITVGVAVDESSIKRLRWTHLAASQTKKDFNEQEMTLDYSAAQSQFGLNTTSNSGKGAIPAVFAPLMNTEISTFATGDTFEFAYRPLSTVSTGEENTGWYDCYSHVVKDLRGVYDYRDNYFASMTDTVFNVLELAKNDQYSGWSDEMLAHYYTEDTNNVNISDALVYLQNYLLTDDKDLLMERTLPSMAYMLTRKSSGFTDEYSITGGVEGQINKELTHSDAFANSTFEGAYLLSRGRMPVFRNIAKKKQITINVDTANQGLKNPSQGLWYDIANGSTDLPTATSYADSYLQNRALISSSSNVDIATFVNVSYYPHFQSQLEMYEATEDEKYLEGAIEGARRALPAMRATDMPLTKDEMYTPNVELINQEYQWITKSTWFYDDTGFRLGATLEDIDPSKTDITGPVFQRKEVTGFTDDALLVEETEYPFWVSSRVGLSLEQATTCSTHNSSIFMSTWAGELLRLGYLSNDQLMMDMARSSLVGRSSNYPGYYLTNYHITYGQEQYPYKGFDSTQIYFTHIPPYLAALQDYLFSNAWVKSDGNIDFPYVRSQGYCWFNTRQYGYEPGNMYDEKNMWPWLKEGTLTISGADAKQIDWIAGRKEGRGAFALTNASDIDQTVTLTFGEDLGVTNNSTAKIYDKAGNVSTGTVSNNQLTVTVPAKGILTVAVDGSGIHIPEYAEGQFDNTANGTDLDMEESALGLMYEGKEYTPSYNTTTLTSKGYSTETGYDVKAYALALDESAYMGYIFVGGRSTDDRTNPKSQAVGDGENGIVQSVLSWHYEGEDTVTTVTDTKFPFEFLIPVTEEPTKKIVFNVETTFGNGETKTLDKEYTIAPKTLKHVKNSYIDISDFTETAVNGTISFITGYGEFGNIKLENNRAALRDYFYYDYDTTETSNTATGLYDAESGAYVLSGVNAMKTQNWSKFIDDFKFQGTYNGTTYTLPITNYATTDSHGEFQFMVDYSAYSDIVTKDTWTKANWTDIKIINEETGKEVPVPAGFNYGLYTDCYRVYFSKIAYIAEQLPEYFEVGPKLTKDTTTSGSKKIYAYGIDGPITTSGGSAATPCKFTDEVSFKFIYDGSEYIVPINRVRADSSYGALYLGITIDAFNAATGLSITDFTDVLTTANIKDVKFTASKINITPFPEGTMFVSAMAINGGNTTGYSDSGVIYIKNNSTPKYYAFAVETAGEYDVYCLAWDDNGSTKRGGIVYVNDVAQDFYSSYELATSTMQPFWEPTGSVTLKSSDVNIIRVPAYVSGDANSRFGGIAFVPSSAEFSMNSTQSATLANKDTGIVDSVAGGRTLSTATELTTISPYEEGVVNVTVNGKAVAVAAGAGLSETEKLYDANGNFIKSATVADAIISAGLTLTNASGQRCAVKVNGKTVYPSRTLVYEGMEITYIDGGRVTKADFSPVLKNTFAHASLPESSSLSTGVCMYVASDFRNNSASAIYYSKLFPFATQGTATTEAADNNLINCQAHGYFTVLPLGATSLGVAEGGKIYFTGNPIVKIEGTNEKLTTGPDANGHITMAYGSAFALDAPDGSKVHAPYAFYNQKSHPDNSSYYDASECFIANTSAINEITAVNRIKDGKYQLLTTGTVPCQITYFNSDGTIKEIVRDQIVTGIAPLTITLAEGEKAFVWESAPYDGPTSILKSGIFKMKPLCGVLTY